MYVYQTTVCSFFFSLMIWLRSTKREKKYIYGICLFTHAWLIIKTRDFKFFFRNFFFQLKYIDRLFVLLWLEAIFLWLLSIYCVDLVIKFVHYSVPIFCNFLRNSESFHYFNRKFSILKMCTIIFFTVKLLLFQLSKWI